MKKLLFVVLSGLIAGSGLCGCEGLYSVDCDAGYTDEYIVKNDTEKEIVISWGEQWLHPSVANLEPDESETITKSWGLGGCYNKHLLEDLFRDDFDMSLIMPDVVITVDGEPVPEEIWLRKYWSFTPGYYDRKYTLIISEEILDD